MAIIFLYVGLGALLTLEEAGLFLLPGDISLVAAGLQGAQGDSIVFISWIVASLGMIAGASALFHGVSRTDMSGKILPRRVMRLIRRYGVWGVAVARVFPGLRNATVFAAASARMPYRHFLYGLMPAAFLWSGLLLALGWFGGATMLQGFGSLHHSRMLQVVSISLMLVAVTFVFWRVRIRGAQARTAARRPATGNS